MTWPLLHNMSSRPTAVLTHDSPLDQGRLMVFELSGPARAIRPRALLAAINAHSFRGSDLAAETALRERINERARKLKWPPVMLAVPQANEKSERCTDLLTILTALSKTGSRVYLRDKEPNIASLPSRRRVVLRFPTTQERANDR